MAEADVFQIWTGGRDRSEPSREFAGDKNMIAQAWR
jgi:hypothetical protein